MLTTIDLSATTSVLSTAAVGGIAWLCRQGWKAYKFFVAHKEEEKLIWNEIRDHIKQNPAALQVVAEVEQAATLPKDSDPTMKQLLIKDVLRDGMAALKIEAAQVDGTSRAALIKLAQDRLPDDVKPLVPSAVDGMLQAIANGAAMASQHKAIQAALELVLDPQTSQEIGQANQAE